MLADCFSYSRIAVFSGLVCFSSVASATMFVIPGPVTPPIVPVVPLPVTPVPVIPVIPPPIAPDPFVPATPPLVVPVPDDSACGELEGSLNAIGDQMVADGHVNVAFCLSLFPDGFQCGGLLSFNIESRESSGARQKRIQYSRRDAAASAPSRKACGPAQAEAAPITRPPTPGWSATTGGAASPALPGPAKRPATATTPTATA